MKQRKLMELLLEVSHESLGLPHNPKIKYRLRKAGRAILFDKGLAALLFVSKLGYHKLPGGGLKEGENLEQGLKREILEETGCEMKVKCEVGITIEYREEFEELQISYCYLAEVTKLGTPEFDEGERQHGFNLKWMALDEAIKTIENEKPDGYEAKFIHQRDLTLLKKAKEITGV